MKKQFNPNFFILKISLGLIPIALVLIIFEKQYLSFVDSIKDKNWLLFIIVFIVMDIAYFIGQKGYIFITNKFNILLNKYLIKKREPKLIITQGKKGFGTYKKSIATGNEIYFSELCEDGKVEFITFGENISDELKEKLIKRFKK